MAEPTTTTGNGKRTTNGTGDPEVVTPNRTWPNLASVCKTLHMRPIQVQALVDSGHLSTFQVGKSIRFDPEQIEELADGLEGIPDDEETADRAASRLGMPAEAVRATAELLRNSAQQVATLHELCMKLHNLNSTAWDKAQDAQDRTIVRLMERNTRYEQVIDGYLNAREEQFNQGLLRDMARVANERKIQRNDEIWSVTKSHLGQLVQLIGARFGIDPKTLRTVTAAAQLFQSIDPTHLNFLLESDFLSDAQKEMLRCVIDPEYVPKAKRAEQAEQAANEPTAQASPASEQATTQAEPAQPKEENQCDSPHQEASAQPPPTPG